MNKRQRKKQDKKITEYIIVNMMRIYYEYDFNYQMAIHGEVFERNGIIIDHDRISSPKDSQEITRAQSKLLED